MDTDTAQDTARIDTDGAGTTISHPVKPLVPRTAWKPGQSGNLAGRPRNRPQGFEHIQTAMKDRGLPKRWLVSKLLDLADVPKEAPIADRRLAYQALELLAGYAYGRPHTSVAVTGAEGGPLLPVIIHHAVVPHAQLPPAERQALLDAERVIEVHPLPAGEPTQAQLDRAERRAADRELASAVAVDAPREDTGDTSEAQAKDDGRDAND